MLILGSSKPYYEQIKEHILRQIHIGDLKPHEQIPSERSLSEQFGVSRLTVSKAIKELVMEGILYTQIGKGTFVKQPSIHQTLDHLTSFSEEMSKLGQSPSSRVLKTAVVDAPVRIAQILGVQKGTELTLIKRARIADGHPVALEMCYLISRYCENILDLYDFSYQSLYRVLREHYQISMNYAEQELEARQPTEEEALVLQIHTSTPILHITRVSYIDTDRPIEYVESAYRGDRYKFRTRLVNIL